MQSSINLLLFFHFFIPVYIIVILVTIFIIQKY